MDYLSDTQRTKLQHALDALGHQAARGVPKRARTGPAPLSFAQQRFWLLHHLDPSSARCNAPAAIRLRGDLDADALEWAIGLVVARHETLRTRFPIVRGEPEARVGDVPPTLLRRRDLSALAPREAEREAQADVAAETARPFDISTEMGIRFSLLRVRLQEHWLVIVAHHIVFDTWSLAILSRELFAAYAARRDDRAVRLPDLPVQYGDVAAWERGERFSGVRDRQLEYWSKTLKGAPELLRLRHDRPRQRLSGHRPSSEAFTLRPDTAGAIAAVSRRENVSPFAIALAALALLLHRYAGSRDIVVGSAVSTRSTRETEGLIGCFLNTVLLRVGIDAGDTFEALLTRARGVALDALDNADVPFDQVIAVLNPSRSPAYTPYAQVMLVVQNAELEVPRVDGLEIVRLPIDGHLAPHQDLVVHLREGAGVVHGLAEYNGDLFEASTIRRMMAGFDRILSVGLPDTRAPLGRVCAPLGAEPHAPTGRRDPAAAREPVFCHTLIERVAAIAPDVIAVTDERAHVTYGALWQHSNALAARLGRRGVRPGAMVVVCLHPSGAAAIALLALQQLGAIAVPLSPALPAGRIRSIANAVSAALVLADGPFTAGVNAEGGAPCVDVTAECAAASAADREPSCGGAIHADQGVCVVGDSRSVSLSDAALWSYGSLASVLDAFGALGIVTRGDAVAAVSPLSTAAGLLEVLGPLTVGARIVCRPSWRAADLTTGPVSFAGVSVVQRSAAGWRAVLDAGLTAAAGVKALVSDDVVPDDIARGLAARGMTVWSLHGSAEAGSCALAAPDAGGAEATSRSPVERAIASVLDASLQPVPAGVAGQLCIAGPTLARGYLGDAALTAERFVPDPHSPRPGQRMFRTRCAAVSTDAGISVIARIDPPALFEGREVDLGMVEATLRRHASIGDLVVAARATPDGKRLTAYVVPRLAAAANHPRSTVSVAELREFARLQLPAFMVPQDIVVVARWPLRDGQLSRPELLLMEPAVAEDATAQQPSTPTEKLVASFYRELFNMTDVGVHADFFELGGDSLRLQHLLARIEERLRVQLPVHVAFANPTIGHLAAYLDRMQRIRMTDEEELAATVEGLTDEEVRQLLQHTIGRRA